MSDPQSYFLDFSDAPPKRRLSFWHWIVGTFALIVLTILGTLATFPLFNLLPVEWKIPLDSNFARSGYGESIMLWVSFVPAFIAPFLVYKFWHKLPFKRLLTTAATFRWKRLWGSMVFVMAAYAALTLLEYIIAPSEFEGVVLHSDKAGYLILLAVTLVFLPIQSASEEILCRGYLNQGLSLITERPWIAFILTSGFFAALHLANPEAEGQILPYMFDTFIFGIAMCWLSHADQGLESAIGVHIGNNLFVFTLFGYEDPTLPPSAILTGPEPVITWMDSFEGAAVTLGLTFIIIQFNRWREKRAVPWIE